MTLIRIILENIKASLEEVCPFEVRLAHSRCPRNNGKTFIILADEGVSYERLQSESSRIRYSAIAAVSVTAAVPVRAGTGELKRIAAAYILPVMTQLGFGIAGFSQSSEKDDIAQGIHTMEIKFRIKGIYTVPLQEEVL